MSLFTFFGNHKRQEEKVSDETLAVVRHIETADPEPTEKPEEPVNKPVIKPQRLATIVEMDEPEIFEQPPQEEEPNQ